MFFFFSDSDQRRLLESIRSGESETVEFKVRRPLQKAVARTISAFANSNGGLLLFGVKDDGEISGLSDVEAVGIVSDLSRLAVDLLQDGYRIGQAELEGKRVVAIQVEPKGSRQPIITADGKYFVRRGAADVELSLTEALTPSHEKSAQHPQNGRTFKAFVAMSFRTEEHPELEDYFEAMKRAANNFKGRILLDKMDESTGDYEITTELMRRIEVADFMIADLTFNAHNVYYEMGFAKGKDKFVIRTALRGTAVEFDITTWHRIQYRNATELETRLEFAFAQFLRVTSKP